MIIEKVIFGEIFSMRYRYLSIPGPLLPTSQEHSHFPLWRRKSQLL